MCDEERICVFTHDLGSTTFFILVPNHPHIRQSKTPSQTKTYPKLISLFQQWAMSSQTWLT